MSAEQEEICRGVADTQHPALVHVHGKTRAPAQVLMCGCDLNTTLPNESLPGDGNFCIIHPVKRFNFRFAEQKEKEQT